MRLDESIEWTSASGDYVRCAPAGTPVHLDSVIGLDGLEQEIYSVKGSAQAGVSVSGTSLQERSIELQVSIARNHAAYRRALLRAFRPTPAPGTLVFRRGSEEWHISAYVESAPVFADDLIATGTISLVCPAPALLAGSGVANIAQWVDNIEFPFEIPSAGHDLSYRMPQLIVNAVNDGDMDAETRIELRVNGNATNPSLVNAVTQEHMSFTASLVAGDVLTVCTGYGKKRVTLLRGGVESNAYNMLDADSAWLTLHPGDNFLRYAADTGADNIDVSIYYCSAYSGV